MKINPAHRNPPDWDSMSQEEKSEHYQKVARPYLEATADNEAHAEDLAAVARLNCPPDLLAKYEY